MKKSELAKAIKSVLAEGMPNFKKPTKFETQNDTPEMTKVRKKLHAIQDRLDQYDADVKAGKMKDPDKRKAVKNKITDDQQAIFAELNKLQKEADAKKKEKLDESKIRQAVREVLAEELRPIGGERNVNEEEYDIVRDINSTLGRNASQDEVEEYLGRSLSGSELKALGFNSGKVTGYKFGQPQYAGQGQKKTYSRRY